MKTGTALHLVILGTACLALAGASLGAGRPESPPNVIVFFADDLGWTDLGSFGSDFYETPNIDRLAARGMRFTNFYAASPVCSPTRAALLSGQTPARVGVTDFLAGHNDTEEKRNRARRRNHLLLPPPQRTEMPEDVVTFADAFQEADYRTFFLGKWHLGDPGRGFGPTDHGFDVNVAGTEQGGPYGGGKYFHPFGHLPNIDSEPGDHLADRMAERAVDLIREAEGRPFALLLSFYDVHTPLMTKEVLREKYRKKAEDNPHAGPRFEPEPPRWNRRVQDHAVYGGMVEVMDGAVGTVVAAVEELGLEGNTIIIFASDNGGLSTSEGHPTSNLPLRAGKGWIYEGGIRVPLIVYWPDITEPGSVTEVPATTEDLFPTMLEMAGLPFRPDAHADGTSLVPVLRQNGDLDRDALFWHYPHYGNQGGTPASAIRQGDWKLIEFFDGKRLELYNLAEDIGERNNLAREHPDRVRSMHERLRAWQQDVGALYPETNSEYDVRLGRRDVSRNPPESLPTPQ